MRKFPSGPTRVGFFFFSTVPVSDTGKLFAGILVKPVEVKPVPFQYFTYLEISKKLIIAITDILSTKSKMYYHTSAYI